MWNWVDSDPTCKKKEEPAGEWQKCSGCKKVRELSTVASTARRLFLGMVLLAYLPKGPLGRPQGSMQGRALLCAQQEVVGNT
jgi:hypothetical protein